MDVIYAEDPTSPEEEEIYAVDKSKFSSIAGFAIATIVWTAALFIPPFRQFCIIAKDGSMQPLLFPLFNYLYYKEGDSRQSLFFPYSSHFIVLKCGSRQFLSLSDFHQIVEAKCGSRQPLPSPHFNYFG